MKKVKEQTQESKDQAIEQAVQEIAEANNLHIYESLRSVPKEAQKNFNNGRFSGTDINPMWRIKKLTEEFGVCGFGWYYDIASREIITSPDGTMCAFVAVKLYVKQDGNWSMPIYGEGGNTFATKTKNGYTQTSDEAYKMALTDAVSNATKQLGLGADIWYSRDVTKYTKPQPQDNGAPKSANERVKAYAERTGKTANLLIKYSVSRVEDIPEEECELMIEQFKDHGIII